MSILYRDILYPIFEELQHDKKTLASCLRVNKIWCEIAVQILWRNPWEHLDYVHDEKKLLLNVIISHLSDEKRTNLNQQFSFITNSHRRPLFNYISFCRHLNLEIIEYTIHSHIKNEEIRNDILKLFINKNAKYTHLYIPSYNDYHLIPGAEHCFSEIKFLKCDGRVNDNNLALLTKVCKSIKELQIYIHKSVNNYGISKLIENQVSLFSIRLVCRYSSDASDDSMFCKTLENSLIKHANTIQYFYICGKLETQILSSFVNLKTLILNGGWFDDYSYLENASLPSLQILDANNINTKSLTNLIKNSGEKLTKLRIYNNNSGFLEVINNNIIIRTLYQHCPNLISLKLFYKEVNVLELEKLLIKCQYLNSLELFFNWNFPQVNFINWDRFFNILVTSSPPSLFKFTFHYPFYKPKLESLKLFFNNWKGRHPMSLIIFTESNLAHEEKLNNLISKYKAKGVIKKFDNNFYNNDDSIESKEKSKRVVEDLKTKAVCIFDGFKKIFN
ncbi:hypothetical protein RhiirA5_408143 [Rhizophagus irregularis]|uniref:F-box domain-containing protein n=1 Tax=Rhizophagus irregularis TaxID=588596 RepID=A0A2N0Q8S8_9GLOM|nr:hypothetical protein RhiirA5_408143 [Rhizophagus irregularis]